MQNIMRYKQIRIANAQRDSEKIQNTLRRNTIQANTNPFSYSYF